MLNGKVVKRKKKMVSFQSWYIKIRQAGSSDNQQFYSLLSNLPMGIDLEKLQTDGLKRGKNYLFAIGIDKYAHISPLSNPVQDVQALVRVLTGKYDFKPQHIITLLDEQATRSAILSQFRKLIKELGSIDNLIIYYAGHGHFDEILDEGFWITVNAGNVEDTSDLDLDETIANNFLKQILRKIPARHIFLISDSCFSGSFFVKERAIAAVREEHFPSRWALTSGRNETVADGNVGENSPFARSLITYLEHTNKKILTVSEIIDHVKEGTAANAVQTPIGSPIEGVGHQNGAFLLRLKISEDELWQSAQAQNTIAAYEDYMESYPLGTGKYRLEARRRITALTRALEESTMWEEISQSPSINGLEAFLKEFPNGKRRKAAEKMLSFLKKQEKDKEESVWPKVKAENSEAAYQRYLDEFPSGLHAEEARGCLVDIRLAARLVLVDERYLDYFSTFCSDLPAFEREHATKITKVVPNGQVYYKVNVILIKGLAASLIQQSAEKEKLLDKLKAEDFDSIILRDIIIDKFKFAYNEQLRLLMSREAKEGSISVQRLNQLYHLYHLTVEFLCFVLLAELWENKIAKKPVKFGEQLKKPLQAFFKMQRINYPDYDFSRLLISLLFQKQVTEAPFFIPEFKDLTEGEDFRIALNFFQVLSPVLKTGFLDRDRLFRLNVLGEYYLTLLLRTLVFISNYELVRVGEVALSSFGRDLSYRIQLTKLSSFGFYYDSFAETILLPEPMPPHSILLVKGKEYQQYLLLSPFMIEGNLKDPSSSLPNLHNLACYEADFQIFYRIKNKSYQLEELSTKKPKEFGWQLNYKTDSYFEVRTKLNEFRAIFDEDAPLEKSAESDS